MGGLGLELFVHAVRELFGQVVLVVFGAFERGALEVVGKLLELQVVASGRRRACFGHRVHLQRALVALQRADGRDGSGFFSVLVGIALTDQSLVC